jgi:acyl carrier protein
VNGTDEVLSFEGFGAELFAELELAPTPLREDTLLVDDLAFDSVLTFELLLVLEDWIGVLLPEALLGQLQTMGDVYAVYETRISQR